MDKIETGGAEQRLRKCGLHCTDCSNPDCAYFCV